MINTYKSQNKIMKNDRKQVLPAFLYFTQYGYFITLKTQIACVINVLSKQKV